MTWIKANKTKLYRLIAEHIFLPKMKYTSFIEAPDRSMYCLEWHTARGVHYRACYTFVDNYPRLVIQYKNEKSKAFINHTIAILDVTNLVEKGMMKGIRSEHQLKSTLLNQKLLSTSA